MDTPLEMGIRLVALRRHRGWTQGDLAARLGVKRQQVQRWESSGYASASLANVARAAEAVGWSSEELLPVAAESAAPYAPAATARVVPVRDLGDVVRRVRECAPALASRYGVRSVAVFGSFARGEQTAESDVDLIVEVADPRMENVFGAEADLERLLGRRTEAGSLASLTPRARNRAEQEAVRVWPA